MITHRFSISGISICDSKIKRHHRRGTSGKANLKDRSSIRGNNVCYQVLTCAIASISSFAFRFGCMRFWLVTNVSVCNFVYLYFCLAVCISACSFAFMPLYVVTGYPFCLFNGKLFCSVDCFFVLVQRNYAKHL